MYKLSKLKQFSSLKGGIYIFISCLIFGTSFFWTFNNTPPGIIGNISYTSDELFTPLRIFERANGAPFSHGTVAVVNGYLFVPFAHDGAETEGGFAFYDLSNPKAPELIFKKQDEETSPLREAHAYGFCMYEGQLLTTLQTNEGLQIWDFAQIDAPVLLSELQLIDIEGNEYAHGSWWIHYQAPYIYVGGGSHGLHIIDASNPEAPQLIKSIPFVELGGFRIGPVYAVGNLMVLSSMETPGIATFDLSDPINPILLDVDRSINNYSILFNGHHIYGVAADRRLHIYDLNDPSDIQRISQSAPVGEKGGYLNLQDNFIHMGMSSAYFKVDISDPLNLDIIGNGSSRIAGRDEDFANVIGNLVFVGNDHENGSALMPHQKEPDTNTPQIISTSPKNGATNQSIHSRIGLCLSDHIEPTSVNAQSLQVKALGGQALEGYWSSQFGIINFCPKEPLALNTVYEVNLPAGGVHDYMGNALEESFSWQFSTGNSLQSLNCSIEAPSRVEVGEEVHFKGSVENEESQADFGWDFDDDTTTDFQIFDSIRHTFNQAGHYHIRLIARDNQQSTSCQTRLLVHEKLSDTPPISSKSMIKDHSRPVVWKTNPDNGSITGMNLHSFDLYKEIKVGLKPESIAQDQYDHLWVVDRKGMEIVLIDPTTANIETRIPLPYGSQPYNILIDHESQFAYVSLYALGSIAKIKVETREIIEILLLSPYTKGLALSGDGKQLFCSAFINLEDQAKLFKIDVESFSLISEIQVDYDENIDSESNGSGKLNYLNSISISPSGKEARIVAKKDNIYRGRYLNGQDLSFENTVRAVSAKVDLDHENPIENPALRIDINNADSPSFVQYSKWGDLLFISLQGNNRVDVFSAYDHSFLSSIEEVGLAPQSLLLSEDGETLYINNFLSRSISVYDISDIVKGENALASKLGEFKTVQEESLPSAILEGKQIFYNAENRKMSKDGYMSCATCHFNGEQDGSNYDFSHLGEGLRNTIALNGKGGSNHGRLHWTANFDEVQDFEGQIRNLSSGQGFLPNNDFFFGNIHQPLGTRKQGLSNALDNLANYVNSLIEWAPSPYKEKGELTESAQRGRLVFEDLNCGLCHSGPDFTNSATGLMHDIGTIKGASGQRLGESILALDVPSLKDLWATAPYLHNGSAKNIKDALEAGNGILNHTLSDISQQDKGDLIAYLKQLDGEEIGLAPPIYFDLKIESGDHPFQKELRVLTDLQDIHKVEFYLNRELKGIREDLNDSFIFEFPQAGKYTIQAKVYHHGGQWATLGEKNLSLFAEDCEVNILSGPNPTFRIYRIQTERFGPFEYQLINLEGKILLSGQSDKNYKQFDLFNFPKGVYLLKVVKDGCISLQKIIKV